MSSSSSPIGGLSPASQYPLLIDLKKNDKKDWVWTSALVAAIAGVVLTGLGGVCLMEMFPSQMLGGPIYSGIVATIGAAILAPAAIILFDRWLNPQE